MTAESFEQAYLDLMAEAFSAFVGGAFMGVFLGLFVAILAVVLAAWSGVFKRDGRYWNILVKIQYLLLPFFLIVFIGAYNGADRSEAAMERGLRTEIAPMLNGELPAVQAFMKLHWTTASAMVDRICEDALAGLRAEADDPDSSWLERKLAQYSYAISYWALKRYLTGLIVEKSLDAVGAAALAKYTQGGNLGLSDSEIGERYTNLLTRMILEADFETVDEELYAVLENVIVKPVEMLYSPVYRALQAFALLYLLLSGAEIFLYRRLRARAKARALETGRPLAAAEGTENG